ncbi:carbon storage regulator [Alkalihalobacillus nanhaiisediminis]|uniref:carbon storage regulator n=1 Tax=Halalkalibacter nanhaiisediminis TaxID=688079 RepID=UPI0011A03F87
MLVIGRRPGESILIDQNIEIRVVKSQDGKLRLGIQAPKEVKIERGEMRGN